MNSESLSVSGRLCSFPCTTPLPLFGTILSGICSGSNSHCRSGPSPTSWGWPSICRCLPTALNHSVPLQAAPLIDHSGGAASANVDSTQWGRQARAAGGRKPGRGSWAQHTSSFSLAQRAITPPPRPRSQLLRSQLVIPTRSKGGQRGSQLNGRAGNNCFFLSLHCLLPRESNTQLSSVITHTAWILNLENSV